ncbi:hypothetical protein GPECTOR_29g106 [Gonium pectorale]|uniref:MYND-type domain-containing protein n=1 Tax=Gonium pectorale TaxID=33097 RepID=A0A150GED5_GONPE|nr:hypothetical protein GPECTOR_29g106 [Gonium pectorale]|eukprot:KXZ48199.1 hypothetical protein GPECTOR_29g106 [Gonium pectorale]
MVLERVATGLPASGGDAELQPELQLDPEKQAHIQAITDTCMSIMSFLFRFLSALARLLCCNSSNGPGSAAQKRVQQLAASALAQSGALEHAMRAALLGWLAAASDWWRTALEVLRHVGPLWEAGDPHKLDSVLEGALGVAVYPGPVALPPEPHPWLRAALDVGLIPELELTLRSAVRGLDAPKARHHRALWGGYPKVYAPLVLAHGEPLQAASLLASLGKAIRSVPPLSVATDNGRDARCRAWVMGHSLAASVGHRGPPAGVPGGGLSAPSQQLASLLSLASVRCLPSLVSVWAQAAAMWGPHVPGCGAVFRHEALRNYKGTAPPLAVFHALYALLDWVLVLAAGAKSPQAAGRGAASATGAAGGPSTEDVDAGQQQQQQQQRQEPGDDDGVSAAGTAPFAASSPMVAKAAGPPAWRSVLLDEVGAVQLVGAALALATHLDHLGAGPELPSQVRCKLAAACRAVAELAVLQRMHQRLDAVDKALEASRAVRASVTEAVSALSTAVATASAADGAVGAGSTSARVAQAAEAAAAKRNMASALPPWEPNLLRLLAAALRADGSAQRSAEVEALAAALESGGAEVSSGRGCTRVLVAVAGASSDPLMLEAEALASALPPPSEAGGLLRTCANSLCANLEGDSEVDLKLLSCGGCGEVGYCCRPCQTAHWRAGHKGECARRRAA